MNEIVSRALVKLTVNGEKRASEVDTRTLLVDLLRDEFMLTGTHIGCLTGNCGACTVMMDGRSVKSCTVLAAQANGSELLTIEGLSSQEDGEDKLHPIQEAFMKHHGLQCGYCTPGMILSAYQLLSRNPDPTEKEIRAAIAGNLCRCTGYQNIVKAIDAAAKLTKQTPKRRPKH